MTDAGPENNELVIKDKRLGLLFVEMPAEDCILVEARRLAADPKCRIPMLATLLSQDPIIVIDLLKAANKASEGGLSVSFTNVDTIVTFLGSREVCELIEALRARPTFSDPALRHTFELLRSSARRTSIIARILSEAVRGDLAEEAQLAGLMTSIGHMIGCVHLREDYRSLFESVPFSALAYRLERDLDFNVDKTRAKYLERNCFPSSLLFVFDKEKDPASQQKLLLRVLVAAAQEVVEAFDSDKWERYAPGNTPPGNSSVRLLPLSDYLYEKVYNRCSVYLKATKDETKRRAEGGLDGLMSSSLSHTSHRAEEDDDEEEDDEEEDETSAPSAGHEPPRPAVRHHKHSHIDKPGEAEEKPVPAKCTWRFIRPKSKEQQQRLRGLSERISSAIESLCRDARDPLELMRSALEVMIQEELFARGAVLHLRAEGDSAQVVFSVGMEHDAGHMIAIDDPFSPLALGSKHLKSFNLPGADESSSPLGNGAYLFSPVEAPGEKRLAVYVDCGLGQSISFEARRIFRTVIELLNGKFPELS